MPLCHDNVGVKGVHWLYIAVDRQAADQTIRSERFAGFDSPVKSVAPSRANQLVRLRRSHLTATLYDSTGFGKLNKKRFTSLAALNYQQPPDEDLGRDHHLQ